MFNYVENITILKDIWYIVLIVIVLFASALLYLQYICDLAPRFEVWIQAQQSLYKDREEQQKLFSKQQVLKFTSLSIKKSHESKTLETGIIENTAVLKDFEERLIILEEENRRLSEVYVMATKLNEDLQNSIVQKDSKIAETAAKVDSYEKINKSLTSRLRTSESDNAAKESKILRIEEAAKTSEESFKLKITILQEDLNLAKTRNNTFEVQTRTLTDKETELHNQISALRSERDNLQSSLTDLKKKMTDQAIFNAKMPATPTTVPKGMTISVCSSKSPDISSPTNSSSNSAAKSLSNSKQPAVSTSAKISTGWDDFLSSANLFFQNENKTVAKLHSEVIGFNSAAIAATAMDSFTVAVERTRGDNKGQVMIGFCAAEKFLRDGFNYFNSGWYLNVPSCELFSPEQCIDEQPVGIEFEDDCNFQLTFTFDRPSRQIRIRFDNHDEDLIVFQDVPLTSELELYPVVDIYDSSVSVTLMDN